VFADLHLHTRFSDGTYTQEELIVEARRHELAALALTDHDTVEGCAPVAVLGAAAGIECLPGVELTAEQDDQELHILGYGMDIADAKLLAALAHFQTVRQERIREMVARLNRFGVELEAETVFMLADCRAPGRPHVGRALVEAGVCATVDEAFERFLKKHRPAWVPKFKISAADAIALLHQAGGAAVMAHPALNRLDDDIPELVEMGLDGIECFHTKHAAATAEHYVRLAEQLRVLVTGGSDCHGMTKGKRVIGTVKLPYARVEQLKARIAEIRSASAPGPAAAGQSPIVNRPS
jgi:3',5'-nucleoside bisphosphate phosphatase